MKLKGIIYKFFVGVFILLMVYLVGPMPSIPVLSRDMPELGINIDQIGDFIFEKESKLNLKPDNGARVVWANEGKVEQTEYSLLYLHGFAASWYEGYPVHVDFAKRYGINAYFPLLTGNGIVTDEPLLDLTADQLYESAKESLKIAHLLGKKVIIMSTSTGGTLSLKLAAEFPELVDSLILFSPNVRIRDGGSFLLDKPWGLQIAGLVEGDYFHFPFSDATPLQCQYWDCKYRLEGVVALQNLVSATMNIDTFHKVKVPVFMAYYYKNEEFQDDMVSVDALLWMFDELGTNNVDKVKKAFPEAGTHIIGSNLFSGAWQDVEMATFQFAEENLGLVPVN